jgi:hypothetical protein
LAASAGLWAVRGNNEKLPEKEELEEEE